MTPTTTLLPALSALLVSAVAATLSAQQAAPPTVEFDVVSIKRNVAGVEAGGGIQTLPDDTLVMRNQPIASLIRSAAPVPVREVEGLPNWATTERYDLTARPPAGSTREQRGVMWQKLFADRMQLIAHVEQREVNAFALVVARSDGRLGPQLKPSTLDCGPRPPGTPPPPPPEPGADFGARCGGSFGRGRIISGGLTLDMLVQSLSGLAGGLVNNRTGLTGFYALTLTYAEPRLDPSSVTIDDAPSFPMALQEQLGLRLQPEKVTVPVFVIDRIERPTEN